MNANEKITKLKKAAHTAFVAVTAVMILVAVVAMALLAMGIVVMLGQGELPELLNLFLERIQQTSSVWSVGIGIFLLACLGAKGAIYLAVLAQLRQILRDIWRKETPFETIHVKRMKRVAVLIFVGSFINMMSIQLGEWIIALVVWFLAIVFDYGCALQQESDETL